jgi:hypothetical protein
MILRFHAFGESHFLDSTRLSVLFPVIRVLPGRRRKSRRDVDGFVRFNPTVVGCGVNYTNFYSFGHVPIGSYVRKDLSRLLQVLTQDVLACTTNEVSWLLYLFWLKLKFFFLLLSCVGCRAMGFNFIQSKSNIPSLWNVYGSKIGRLLFYQEAC